LRGAPILRRSYCEHSAQIETLLRANNLDADHGHEVDSERDLILLLEAGLGVAILPGSTSIPPTLAHWTVNSINLRRTVYVYSVAGRQRSAVASALLKSLRAADWARYEN
jgi:DNA-binding transcriptional LysR family regulator